MSEPVNVTDLAVCQRQLWEAVDKITLASERRVLREQDAEIVEQYAADPSLRMCHVDAYRAATASFGTVPALWEQAELALTTGSEKTDGGGRTPLRERSPADLDLMETMLTIRESMAWQLKGRHVTPREGIMPQMRQLASHVVAHEPGHVDWWRFRFEQWARILTRHLHALDAGPRPVRLRNSQCPNCSAKTVVTDGPDGTPVVAPPILIDFTSEGFIRAAECTACHHAWFRGEQMAQLAEDLAKPA